ncbi:MAG: TOBE domain-containing protein [Thermoplasmata archaeon]|nr:TOBE domain-containing protein [Thermoplasmata archaeon]
MTARATPVTEIDLALLRALTTAPTLVAACRRLGISRDRGVYRLARLARMAGGPVVASEHGGRYGGGSHLTVRGRRLLRRGADAFLLSSDGRTGPTEGGALHGTYHARPEPTVVLGQGLVLHVAFVAHEGEPVVVAVDPEAVLLAPRAFASSARNRFSGQVLALRRRAASTREVTVAVRGHRFRAAVTNQSVRELRLARGRRVVLYVKATAIRRVAATVSRERPRR